MNFFYAINVTDRYRFPIPQKESKREQKPIRYEEEQAPPLPIDSEVPNHVSTNDSEEYEEKDQHKVTGIFPSPHHQHHKKDKDSEHLLDYFDAFKKENLSEECEKGLYCDDILQFLDAFLVEMNTKQSSTLGDLLDTFTLYVNNHSEDLQQLMKTMNVKQLIAPYMEVNLPVKIIGEFNRLGHGDPRAHLYQLNPVWGPGIKEFGFFLDRYESTNEVLCMFVWSTIDQAVVPMPAVNLNPYPLCWVCDKGFGTRSCEQCNVAKYCSKECQLADWIRHGGPMCDLMASVSKKVKHLCFS